MEPQKELSVGTLLKSEREKKGLRLIQIARSTKLREHFLEAIENEEWQKLPSPVYVKGFIRSYAKSIGLDSQEIIKLYKKSAPEKKIIPAPLIREKASHKKKTLLFILPVFIVLALLVFLKTGEKNLLQEKRDITSLKEVNKEEPGPAEVIEEKDTDPVAENHETAIKKSEEPDPVVIPKEDIPDVSSDEEAFLQDNSNTEQYESQSGEIEDLVLTGIVNMKTYVKIYVDNNPPKEYIFQPGSRPQWVAKKGFDVVVGNAAGIEFEFNGKNIMDLGGPGKVIRMRFPDNFESTTYGN